MLWEVNTWHILDRQQCFYKGKGKRLNGGGLCFGRLKPLSKNHYLCGFVFLARFSHGNFY
jgi:hypothetical protein